MPFMIKSILTGKQKSFVYISTYSQIGNKEDGSNYGRDKTQILLVIENPENRRTKVTVLGI